MSGVAVKNILNTVWERRYLNNILLMVGFGILSFLMAKIRFFIPGFNSGTSDLSEIPNLIAVIYLPHWIYLVGVTFIGSIGRLVTPDQSYLASSIAHLLSSVFAWYFYAYIRRNITTLFRLGTLWVIMVLLYYFVILVPFMLLSYSVFGIIHVSNVKDVLRNTLVAIPNELLTSVVITTFYVVLYQMTKLMEVKNLELSLALNKAEESDRLKSAFLANMSHEIRTPMNGIIGFSSLLSDEELSTTKRKEYVEIIVNSSNQLLAIINDILDISRIEAGQTELNFEEVSVNSLFDNLALFYGSKAAGKSIEFRVIKPLPDDESIIITDRSKLQQVLDNLLNNAFKFTTEGHITLGYEKKDQKVRFYVEDTGIGISPVDQGKIFERFMQVESTFSRSYGGTGLGLSISKGLVELLGGKIKVSSVPGQGSAFQFVLPTRQIIKSVKLPMPQVNGKNQQLGLNGLTVLIVEDETYNYLFLAEMITSLRGHVLHAKNGLDAVEACRSHSEIDLVLMDIKMPVMNGLDATRQIRTFNPNVPIIAQTAYALGGDKEKALVAGCNDYLTKPILKSDLLNCLARHLKYKN